MNKNRRKINPYLDIPDVSNMKVVNQYARSVKFPEDMIHYWPMNGTDLGNDIVGGNNCTLLNVSLTTGRNGDPNTAYLFQGDATSYMEQINTLNIPVWTYSVWISPDNPLFWMVIHGGGGDDRYLAITTLYVGIYNRTIQTYLFGTNPGWLNLIYTYDGTRYKAYINGVSDGSTLVFENQFFNHPDTKYFGRTGVNNNHWYQGKQAETRIYDRVLSDAEIKLIANN